MTYLNFKQLIPTSAYIHIPFCRRRCFYCDFPVSVLGDRGNLTYASTIEEYVGVLCQEIMTTPTMGMPLKTVFFGGGTPSLLPAKELALILDSLNRHFGIATDAEISMEMDPGTFSIEQLRGYRDAGVNRISLGVQAFQDELLIICGRSHSQQDILEAIDLIQQLNIDNFSLDLISGLPKQTWQQWQESLQIAIEINPNHISCYDLVLEPVTAFGKQYQPGEKPLPSDEMTAQMYKTASTMLRGAGYEHYEISNYARSNHRCRHNLVYWENKPYYAFGMGAASYVQGKRFTRPRTRWEYYLWVEKLIAANGAIELPEISAEDFLLETLMLGLRLARGVNLSEIQENFGQEVLIKISNSLQSFYDRGWIETSTINDKNINFRDVLKQQKTVYLKLTDPAGFLFSNTILATLFKELD